MTSSSIRILDTRGLGLTTVATMLERPPSKVDPSIVQAVDGILGAVRERGDVALVELTARFDGFVASHPRDLVITPGDFEIAAAALPSDAQAALTLAAQRIERYHTAAVPKSWRIKDEHGSLLGQEIRPLDRVGIYIPGGRGVCPSTVLLPDMPAPVPALR